jgi:hypothetical protein
MPVSPHDDGAINWACLASLIETAKLHGIDPQAYLADILAKLVNGWPVVSIIFRTFDQARAAPVSRTCC